VKQPPAVVGTDERWLTRGVAGIGTASLLADVGHEVPTALPSLLTSTLGAPAAALALIEGVSDWPVQPASVAGRWPTTRDAGAGSRSAAKPAPRR